MEYTVDAVQCPFVQVDVVALLSDVILHLVPVHDELLHVVPDELVASAVGVGAQLAGELLVIILDPFKHVRGEIHLVSTVVGDYASHDGTVEGERLLAQ